MLFNNFTRRQKELIKSKGGLFINSIVDEVILMPPDMGLAFLLFIKGACDDWIKELEKQVKKRR